MPYRQRWNSFEARLVANTDLVVFEEITVIQRCIIDAAKRNLYETIVGSGELDDLADPTTMTDARPPVTVEATVKNPAVSLGDRLLLDGTLITLNGGGINNIIADISDYDLPYVTAGKTADNRLSLTYKGPNTAWDFEVGTPATDSANGKVGLFANTYSPEVPDSQEYYQTWSGTRTDRRKWDHIQQVRTHFHALGYDINVVLNPCTNRTFMWKVYW